MFPQYFKLILTAFFYYIFKDILGDCIVVRVQLKASCNAGIPFGGTFWGGSVFSTSLQSVSVLVSLGFHFAMSSPLPFRRSLHEKSTGRSVKPSTDRRPPLACSQSSGHENLLSSFSPQALGFHGPRITSSIAEFGLPGSNFISKTTSYTHKLFDSPQAAL